MDSLAGVSALKWVLVVFHFPIMVFRANLQRAEILLLLWKKQDCVTCNIPVNSDTHYEQDKISIFFSYFSVDSAAAGYITNEFNT